MFSGGPQDRDRAEHYVRNQEEHHRRRMFQDEYRAMLTRYGIELNARVPVQVLGRCPRLRWLWPAAKCAWPGVGPRALP